MNLTRRTPFKSSASAALIGITGRIAFAAITYNYKVATNVPMAHPLYIRLNETAAKTKQQTSGLVVIRVFPHGQLGSDTDMLSQVRSGGVDFLRTTGRSRSAAHRPVGRSRNAVTGTRWRTTAPAR